MRPTGPNTNHLSKGNTHMSHGITDHDQMYSVRQVPWHGLGVVLDEYPKSIDDALIKARLSWKIAHGDVLVVKRPAWADDFGVEHPAELVSARGFKATCARTP